MKVKMVLGAIFSVALAGVLSLSTTACGKKDDISSDPKVLNVALLGACAESGAMGLDQKDILSALSMRLKPSLLPMNEKALRLGAEGVK